MKISGVIQSGVGKGAFFTQVDWVVKQCQGLLGYKPFPGTLNVHVCEADVKKIETFLMSTDGELLPDDPKFCAAKVKKISVNGVPAAVVLPSEDVRVHENRVLEIIAAQKLKEALGLDDGDEVTLTDQKP
jgi:riboflavin kinase